MQAPQTTYQWKRAYGLDIAAIALLLLSAYLLSSSGQHHRYSYYGNLRNVVFLAWAISAFRFLAFRWFPAVILSVGLVWLFNPIVPVMMRKWQWQPFDRWTMLFSVAAALALAILSFRENHNMKTIP
jgi:hypothetical protein